jgi:hypothetical protein
MMETWRATGVSFPYSLPVSALMLKLPQISPSWSLQQICLRAALPREVFPIMAGTARHADWTTMRFQTSLFDLFF